MRVAIVSGIVVDRDAISGSVEWHARLMGEMPEVSSISVFAHHVERPLPAGVDVYEMETSWDLLRHPAFAGADVAVFHFGIRYDLFDALVLMPGPGLPVPVVQYHNVTPRDLVPEDQRAIIDRSTEQAELIAHAERVWADSPFNREQLIEAGIDPARCVVSPIPVKALGAIRPRRGELQRVLYVGRVVPAKGIDTLLGAFEMLPAAVRQQAELVLCGNVGFSDSTYVTSLLQRIEDSPALRNHVHLVGEASDEELWDLYASSDVFATASLHEGLCLPIVEASMAGCAVVGTANSNIRYLLPPEQLAPTGDVAGFSQVLERALGRARSGPVPALPCVHDHERGVVAAAIRQDLVSLSSNRAQALRGEVVDA